MCGSRKPLTPAARWARWSPTSPGAPTASVRPWPTWCTLPFIGSAISDVKTNPSNGTIELKGLLGTITAKPTVVNKGISMQIVDLSAIGLSWPRETLQPILDKFTAQLTENYPMGIHADSVQVTDEGVEAKFSTTNASMPRADRGPLLRQALGFSAPRT